MTSKKPSRHGSDQKRSLRSTHGFPVSVSTVHSNRPSAKGVSFSVVSKGFKPFLSPEPFGPLEAYLLALTIDHGCNSAESTLFSLAGQLRPPFYKEGIPIPRSTTFLFCRTKLQKELRIPNATISSKEERWPKPRFASAPPGSVVF